MIFITVGTQDKDFSRPLKELERLKIDHKIEDEIIVQAGFTNFESDYMKVLKYIPYDDFNNYIEKADIVITHGGVGNIINAIKLKKIVIAIARLSKYKEHINDHQLQVVGELARDGYIIECNDEKLLEEKIKLARDFKPKKYTENTKKFNKKFLDLVNNLLDNNKENKENK